MNNKEFLKQVSNVDLLKELERRMLINREVDPQGIDFYPKRGIIETGGRMNEEGKWITDYRLDLLEIVKKYQLKYGKFKSK